MTKPNLTEIIVLLDRSGSMQEIKSDMEGGFDAFVEGQKQVPGECFVSLYQFDDRFEPVYVGRPIADIPKLKLVPRGNTALWDALDRTINLTGQRLANLPEWERPGKVIVVVITDGQENSSRFISLEQVKSKIVRQEQQYSWGFIYLGSSPTTAQDAVDLGIHAYSNYVASPGGVVGMSNVVNNVMRSYRLAPENQTFDLSAMLPKNIAEEDPVNTTFVGIAPPITSTITSSKP